jgi:hypothetical protein
MYCSLCIEQCLCCWLYTALTASFRRMLLCVFYVMFSRGVSNWTRRAAACMQRTYCGGWLVACVESDVLCIAFLLYSIPAVDAANTRLSYQG